MEDVAHSCADAHWDDELILNDGFERHVGWQTPAASHPADYSTTRAHSGSRSVHTGIENAEDNVYGHSSAWQAVSIPATATAANLRLWEYSFSEATEGWQWQGLTSFSGDPRLLQATDDSQYLSVLDEQRNWIETLLWQRSNARSRVERNYDLTTYAGQTILLHFGTVNDGQDGVTTMYLDDVSLTARSGT